MTHNELMRTLSRRHALEKIEGVYPKGDIEKSVQSMTIRMAASELASFAKGIQKDLNQPARPVIRQPLVEVKHTQITMVNGKLKMLKFDKNPNIKNRRVYKDFITIEATELCFEKIWADNHPDEVRGSKVKDGSKESFFEE